MKLITPVITLIVAHLPSILTTKSEPSIHAQLKSVLSPGASIYFPGSEEFDIVTERYQNWKPPRFIAAVEVAAAKDVQKTVRDRHMPIEINSDYTSIQRYNSRIVSAYRF